MSHPLTNCNESPKLSSPVLQPLFGAFARARDRMLSCASPYAPSCISRRAICFLAIPGLVASGLVALAVGGVALAGEYHSNPWLLSWIPATCCVTNDCCWEVSERELRALPDDVWEVLSTGQVRRRTAWSPDGKFYRCACDYDYAEKHWVKHQGANTRCLFVPMRSASR